MNDEAIIRQAVQNTIDQVGCTGKIHVCWGLCEHTVKAPIPNEPLKISAKREQEIFINRVMYHVRAIEDKINQDRIRAAAIMVDLNVVEESYADGFKTGANWPYEYVAGGPFHFSAGEYESDRHKAIAEQTKAEWAAWMQGFYDGNGIKQGAHHANITSYHLA